MSQLTISNTEISIVVDSHGAELTSLKKIHTEYLYQKQDGFWQRQSPILFPIVGGLKGGQYEYNENIYSLAQHGFARDMEWECRIDNDSRIICVLRSNAETRLKYPFDFLLTLTYTIYESTLYTEYTIENTSEEDGLIASIGAHPAFATNGNIGEYSLKFSSDENLEVDQLDGGLLAFKKIIDLDNHILHLSEELFEKDALILRGLKTSRIELFKGEKLVFTFDRGNFPHFGIWKQKDAPFICLEPWHGFADTKNSSGILTEKEGLFALEPYESRDFAWFIQL
ncbi:aldose 1-epimerase family protein [Candidatus Gracilibacteria bacterium]|nr:aldose 1-epimerase family protein [Candidatus Gracilibacteria bacterium]